MDFLRGYAAFLDLKYWFNPNPVPLGPSLVSSILSFFAWFVVAAAILRIIARVIAKRDELMAGVLRRFSGPLLTTGVLGVLFLFFTYEQLPLFGMRFWFLFLFLMFLGLLVRPILYAVRDYPRKKHALADKLRKEKWLPKKN